jgi:hypothetical protein
MISLIILSLFVFPTILLENFMSVACILLLFLFVRVHVSALNVRIDLKYALYFKI